MRVLYSVNSTLKRKILLGLSVALIVSSSILSFSLAVCVIVAVAATTTFCLCQVFLGRQDDSKAIDSRHSSVSHFRV